MTSTMGGTTMPATDWAHAARQAERMVAESAGSGAVQRAGREPTPVAMGATTQQAWWQSSTMFHGLNYAYSPQAVGYDILSSYILQPDIDLHYVKEHMVEWMALATGLGNMSAPTSTGPTFSLL